MSLISKQLLLNTLNLPVELINIVKEYTFHKIKKIPKIDKRYQLLLTIPIIENYPLEEMDFVYLSITDDKFYFLVYSTDKIQLQTLLYTDNNEVYFIDGQMIPRE